MINDLKHLVCVCSKQRVVYTYRLLQTHTGHYMLMVNTHTHTTFSLRWSGCDLHHHTRVCSSAPVRTVSSLHALLLPSDRRKRQRDIFQDSGRPDPPLQEEEPGPGHAPAPLRQKEDGHVDHAPKSSPTPAAPDAPQRGGQRLRECVLR